jgi:hypothetical protein
MKRTTAVAILASVLFVSPGTGETWFFVPEPGEPNPLGLTVDTTRCVEDMPCWDCRTMGNGICGTDIATGPNAYEHGEYVGGYN